MQQVLENWCIAEDDVLWFCPEQISWPFCVIFQYEFWLISDVKYIGIVWHGSHLSKKKRKIRLLFYHCDITDRDIEAYNVVIRICLRETP